MKDSEAEKRHSEVEKIDTKWKGKVALLFVQQLAD
jgi:hypothetical protein